jgi:Right handed beta helix region
MRLPALLTIAIALAAPASASAADLYVNAHATGCSDAAGVAVARDPATPWCSPAPATRLASAGDVVHLASATYGDQLRPETSGTASQPIVYQADGPVTLLAPSGTVTVMLTGIHDVVLRGFTVRADAPQAIWVDDASRILIDHDTVANASGVGVQIKRGSAVTITHARLINNARAGLLDMSPARGTTLSSSLVSANGHDGERYDGDGVELDGTGALVTGNRITRNGDSIGFEHGIYAGSTARNYTISGNTIGANAGADIKAAGGPALVVGNRLRSGLFGLVLSDNPAPITVEYNLIQGRFQHGVLLTTGHTAARGRLWNNTVEQTGRSTSSGNASAVFVASAAQLELRNNLIAYTNRDALGTALMINDRALVGSFVSSTNWYSSTDSGLRRLAWNGSRVTFGQWRRLSGQDASSLDSRPPRFTAGGRVAAGNIGIGRGTRLGLTHDFAGNPVDPSTHPDIGAFQRPA